MNNPAKENWLHTTVQSGLFRIVIVTGAALLIGGLIYFQGQSARFADPQVVVREYMSRVYARDYGQVYPLVSAVDREYKTLEEYLRENSSFTGFRLEASRKLASYIEFKEIQVEAQEDSAVVTVDFVVPDGNAEAVREIIFAEDHKLTDAERRDLLENLDRLHEEGRIPTFEGEQSFDLVREKLGWRIRENWAEATRVHLSGEIRNGLPWEFESLQEVVLAKPGETVRAIYRAKNLSGQEVTAKARHIVQPEEYHDFLDTIQCFCLIQQTLKPGEEMEMPVVFRVAWDVPPEVKDFYVHYEFYPIESFPGEVH
jgi:hypothetical protein